jgi:proton glutamate symport protein
MNPNPTQGKPAESTQEQSTLARSRRNADRTSGIVPLVFYAVGIALSLAHAHGDVGGSLRRVSLGILVVYVLRRRSLLVWTFYAMLLGAELGFDAPQVAAQTRFLADIFLRLIRMIVAPLIFGGLVTGIAGHKELRGVGRVAAKALVFFEVVTTLGLLLGAIAMNVSRAGVGVALAAPVGPAVATAHLGWQDVLLNAFPENIAQAVAQNQILQVAVFSVLFGVALALLPEPRRAPLVNVLQSLTETMFRMTRIVMLMAPVAAGAALAYAVGSMGLATLLPLAKLVITYYAALAAFILLVLLPSAVIARIPLRRFVAAIGEPAAIGFATTTSEVALPLAMERMEEFGVPRWMVSFVIPMGYSFNMTGSSLYLSMAAIFAAQAAGIHLSVGEQIAMLATLVLTSKGVAGVPRAVFVILMGMAASFHIPTTAVLLLLGVDTIIDMGRASMNVVGNCLASAVVARWEGQLPTKGTEAPKD